MCNVVFVIQVVLERYFAPVLLLWRRWRAGRPYRRVPLTQGRFARVDPQDYATLARHRWCAARQGRRMYAVRRDHGRQLRMHRVILHAPPGTRIDHIDRDGLNNTRRNLRPTTSRHPRTLRLASPPSAAKSHPRCHPAPPDPKPQSNPDEPMRPARTHPPNKAPPSPEPTPVPPPPGPRHLTL